MREITVPPEAANGRLNKYLQKYLNGTNMSNIYKLLRKRLIVLNGKRADGAEIVAAGDKIVLYLSEETIATLQTQKTVEAAGALSVVYEDDNILIVNKPVGTLTQKAHSTDKDTLAERVLYHLYLNGAYDPNNTENAFIPAPLNRLDRNTSGLVIIGKNLESAQILSTAIRLRKLDKQYLAVVYGRARAQTITTGHKKDEKTNRVTVTADGDECETKIEILSATEGYSVLNVRLITGKSHQIRAHCQNIGHPILGDTKYFCEASERLSKVYGLKTQLLHAHKLVFGALTGRLSYLTGRAFTAEPTAAFARFIQQ